MEKQLGAQVAQVVAWCVVLGLSACATKTNSHMHFSETQITHALKGHTIHHTQVFSKDGQWIVYDTRNDDTQIGSTGSIEMVHVNSGEVRVLYKTANQTEYGPGVGAATFSPVQDRVLFIHGIRNADASRPYGMTRRSGVAVDVGRPGEPIFMDARDVTPPFTPGALRGGTHAHSWSGDGQWISFTYNDYVMEQLAKADTSVKDLRTVGIMMPGIVDVPLDSTLENHSGTCFSVLVTAVTEHPTPGSDEIDKAFDECWIGTNGYIKTDGERQRRAIAFQGNVRGDEGEVITEVFVVDLPANLVDAADAQLLAGTLDTRPAVPKGIEQRRITFSKQGVSGPRHWLRTTPDGRMICFLSEDNNGIIQLFGVSPNGGDVVQVTRNEFPVDGPFTISPDGVWIAYPADRSMFITALATGDTHRLTPRATDSEQPVGAPNWSPSGDAIAYNGYVLSGGKRYLQVFLLRR